MPRLKSAIDIEAMENAPDEPGEFKVYRFHHCTARHRTFVTAARCIWNRAGYRISGDGPYVVLEWFWCQCCGRTADIRLHRDQKQAMEAHGRKEAEHRNGKCCGSCTRTTDLIVLSASVLEGWDSFRERRPAR